MRYRRPNGSEVLALAIRLDYVESKLDESISSFKEAMQQMENRHKDDNKEHSTCIKNLI